MTYSTCEYSQLLILEEQTLDRIFEVDKEIIDVKLKRMWRWDSDLIQAEKEARISELLDYRSSILCSLKLIKKKIKAMEILLKYSNDLF